jgi:hypothetical protein
MVLSDEVPLAETLLLLASTFEKFPKKIKYSFSPKGDRMIERLLI